jgi:mono/diheme cytochrome c family protein
VTTLVIFAVAAVAMLVVMYSGIIDVGARKPHYALTKWVLETTMEHLVERRAEQISPPPEYRATPHTMQHFGHMCELCHGGPGKEPSEIGKGLRPDPPDLTKVADHLTPSEVFWIVKNGIRMTAMPAFAETHTDQELWELVSFVKSLPRLSAGEYRKAVHSGKPEHDAAHRH